MQAPPRGRKPIRRADARTAVPDATAGHVPRARSWAVFERPQCSTCRKTTGPLRPVRRQRRTISGEQPRGLFANAYLLLALTSLFWSGNHIVGRAIAGEVPPLGISTLRWLIPILILLPDRTSPPRARLAGHPQPLARAAVGRAHRGRPVQRPAICRAPAHDGAERVRHQLADAGHHRGGRRADLQGSPERRPGDRGHDLVRRRDRDRGARRSLDALARCPSTRAT